jgi:hypothetical protein
MAPKLTAAQRAKVRQYDAAGKARWVERRRRLVLELREAGWTLPELAVLLGLTKQGVARIEATQESD